MKITKRELRRLLGEAKWEKGYESWDDWQNPGNYAPTEKPVSKAAAEEKVAYAPSGRVEDPSREEMWGFDAEPDYDVMDVDPASMFDYETGEDDVPYGAADYALMQGRGRRTDEGRRLREAKGDKKKRDDVGEKTRPDGYYDLPAFMSISKQSPAKYSSFHADDPALVDPTGGDIDADALRIVRQLQARGVGQKEDKKKKKLKEATVSVTRRDIRRLVNEALSEMGMMGGHGGMRRPRRSMCLYVTYGGRGAYYYIAPPPPSELDPLEAEDIAEKTGTDVTAELVPEGMEMADTLTLYSWLQDHNEITHVHDLESSGGLVSKDGYMEQLLAVAKSEGLIAPQDEINESMGRREDDVDCLYILRGNYFVAKPYIEDLSLLPEMGENITDQIMSGGKALRASNVYEFLSNNPQVAVVCRGGIYEMADDYMMSLEDAMGFSTGPVNEGSFPEEIEGAYGAEPPEDADLYGPGGEYLPSEEPDPELYALFEPLRKDYKRFAHIKTPSFEDLMSGGKRRMREATELDEMGRRDDSFLDYPPEDIPDMEDMYDPDYYEGLEDEEDDYTYGDDPDEFLDLPAGEIQQRLDRGPMPRRGLRETDAEKPAAAKAEKGEAVNEARWAKLAGILKG